MGRRRGLAECASVGYGIICVMVVVLACSGIVQGGLHKQHGILVMGDTGRL